MMNKGREIVPDEIRVANSICRHVINLRLSEPHQRIDILWTSTVRILVHLRAVRSVRVGLRTNVPTLRLHVERIGARKHAAPYTAIAIVERVSQGAICP
jgi:hypothetical protein